jgi:hypothetical protein
VVVGTFSWSVVRQVTDDVVGIESFMSVIWIAITAINIYASS